MTNDTVEKIEAKNHTHGKLCMPKDKCFHVFNGSPVCCLNDLCATFDCLTDEQFYPHVTPEGNDFANWVDYVLGDPICAAALRFADTRKEMDFVIRKTLELHHG